MAIGASTQWHIRTTGNELNGGGFDPSISGAGTNYADQSTYQLALTDLAASGTTTLTSATGGFTAAMIGNCIRIAAGGGFSGGYYFVTAVSDTNTVTLDRTPGTGSNGVGRLGGPFNHIRNFLVGGNHTQPLLASPLVGGNTIYIRGSGTNDPASFDYNWFEQSGQFYSQWAGFGTSNKVRVIGVNGRPHMKVNHLMWYQAVGYRFENLKFTIGSDGYANQYGITGNSNNEHYDIIVDVAGYAASALQGTLIANCEIRNSGTKTDAGNTALYGVKVLSYYGRMTNTVVKDQRGGGVYLEGQMTLLDNSIIARNKGNGVYVNTSILYNNVISNNTIDANTGHGVVLDNNIAVTSARVAGNIISNHSGVGKSGIFCNNTAAYNDKRIRQLDFNNLYNNTTNYTNISAGANDTYLDPQYADTANDNWSVGGNMKGKGWPRTFNGATMTSYVDAGGAQRQEPATPNMGVYTASPL